TYCNAAAARLIGRDVDDVEGQPFDDVVHLFSERTQEPLPGIMEVGRSGGGMLRLPAFALLQTTNGELKPVEDSIAPLRDRSGQR
ncbi:PAS domain-containing protein, partial [Acinetobacter baumannii]